MLSGIGGANCRHNGGVNMARAIDILFPALLSLGLLVLSVSLFVGDRFVDGTVVLVASVGIAIFGAYCFRAAGWIDVENIEEFESRSHLDEIADEIVRVRPDAYIAESPDIVRSGSFFSLNKDTFSDFTIQKLDMFDILHFYCARPAVAYDKAFGQFLIDLAHDGKLVIYTFTDSVGYDEFIDWLSEVQLEQNVRDRILGLILPAEVRLPSFNQAFFLKKDDERVYLNFGFSTQVDQDGRSHFYALVPEGTHPRCLRESLSLIRHAISDARDRNVGPDIDGIDAWKRASGLSESDFEIAPTKIA